MSGFQSIVGHEDIIQHMKHSLESGKVSHAYLFVGEAGSGKKLLARTFAMALQCQKGGTEPCMECDSCKRAESRTHPDIIMVYHEKPNTISVQDVRTQIVSDVAIKPYYGKYKIYIIPDAEKMTPQAQNALLKTIEEPPDYAVFMILTRQEEAILPTILSRCIRLDVKPVSDEQVREHLMQHLNVVDYQADIDVSLAQGNIGKAQRAAQSAEFAEMTQQALYILKNAQNMEVHELVDLIKELTAQKDQIEDYLDIFRLWFRDVVMFKATAEIDHLVFKNEINEIRNQASKISYEGLERILDAIDKAVVRLHANVNFDLVMELLFLTIRER